MPAPATPSRGNQRAGLAAALHKSKGGAPWLRVVQTARCRAVGARPRAGLRATVRFLPLPVADQRPASPLRRVDTRDPGWQIPAVRWLGLDVGTKTIGVALSDEEGVVAMPLRTLTRHGGQRDLDAVAGLLSETGAGALVVGLPLDLEGGEGDAARRARALGERLEAHLRCPVSYWDERFSTAQAERALLEGGVSRKRRRRVVDQLAATIILQSYLDHSRGAAA